ncbi:MAG: hypothetical protein ACTHJ6_13720 [Oryzihumus sp.]
MGGAGLLLRAVLEELPAGYAALPAAVPAADCAAGRPIKPVS